MFGWFRKMVAPTETSNPTGAAAFHAGREAGQAMTTAIDAFLERRFTEVGGNFLQVFDDRLKTISDEPEHPPKVVAKIEFDLFCEHLRTAEARLKAEVEDVERKWFELADTSGVRETLDALVAKRLSDSFANLRAVALQRMVEAVAVTEKGAQQ